MATTALIWPILLMVIINHVCGEHLPQMRTVSGGHYHEDIRKLQTFKASLVTKRNTIRSASSSFSLSSSPLPPVGLKEPRVYFVTSYGADPTGKSDSTEALLAAIADAAKGPNEGSLIEGIRNLGGAEINLQGGNYMISRPLKFPAAGVGNVMIHGGSVRASKSFPTEGYLFELSASFDPKNCTSSSYNYEYITFKDLFLDSNFCGGGISVINSLRIGVDNCYITHFTTNGILVRAGHETYIRNSFIGQHITAGGDKDEKNFSGTGISLEGNDNAVTDVVIFSAAIGIMVTGQANIITGVHCYNKATGFGGTGIYLKLPGLAQTRIVNSYMDYTSIVAEDPVQLHISSTFFLGDANVVLKSIHGVANGVNIVDNMFSGSKSGIEIVELDQSNGGFKQIDQVVVDRNIVSGMKTKATVAKMRVQGNGTSIWVADFNSVLLFPNLIKNVEYSLSCSGNTFPSHALRDVSENRVVIETKEAVTGNVFVTVEQGIAI